MAESGQIFAVPASSFVNESHRGHVVVSGSYGGDYNAFHAGKWGIRGVVLNDAGIGKDDAGIHGITYLEQIGLAAATADVNTCHIADGEHMLEHGRISFVNRFAANLGCKVGDTVRSVAEKMRTAPIATGELSAIAGGKRYTLSETPGKPKVIALDAAPMLAPGDEGAIAVTGSHAALFRGKPDNVIPFPLRAVFFSDGGVGMDNAGVSRLPNLDEKGIPGGAAAAMSARIGDARSIYNDGVFSHVNQRARAEGARPGMPVREFVALLLDRS
ncbi:MAG TPA: hypothetical protein VHA70_06525 [Bauldia sp.]|nr:hypothetical protein [Bauldia sp.]